MANPKNPAFDPLAIGTLARAYANISHDAVRRAVAYQAEHPNTRLGEALVDLALMDQRRVTDLVRRQAALRAGNPTSNDVRIMTDFALRLSARVQAHVDTLAKARGIKPDKK